MVTKEVADALQPSCGTLDCHRQVTRNLRLFGARGLRLDPTHTSPDRLETCLLAEPKRRIAGARCQAAARVTAAASFDRRDGCVR